MEADRGDRLWRQTEETDGSRQRMQTVEEDRGDRLWSQTEETDCGGDGQLRGR